MHKKKLHAKCSPSTNKLSISKLRMVSSPATSICKLLLQSIKIQSPATGCYQHAQNGRAVLLVRLAAALEEVVVYQSLDITQGAGGEIAVSGETVACQSR